jgi:hypothetical protein
MSLTPIIMLSLLCFLSAFLLVRNFRHKRPLKAKIAARWGKTDPLLIIREMGWKLAFAVLALSWFGVALFVIAIIK